MRWVDRSHVHSTRLILKKSFLRWNSQIKMMKPHVQSLSKRFRKISSFPVRRNLRLMVLGTWKSKWDKMVNIWSFHKRRSFFFKNCIKMSTQKVHKIFMIDLQNIIQFITRLIIPMIKARLDQELLSIFQVNRLCHKLLKIIKILVLISGR